jgi:hypothetical protein
MKILTVPSSNKMLTALRSRVISFNHKFKMLMNAGGKGQEPGMQRCQSGKRWKKIRNVMKPVKERRVR